MVRSFFPLDYQSAPTLTVAEPGPDAEEFDVIIVGAGPAGLSAAVHLAQLVRNEGRDDLSIAVLEKAERLGGHSLSGAILNPGPLRRLFPDTPDREFPFARKVTKDRLYLLTPKRAFPMPVPPTMGNHGNYVVSLGEVVRWLGDRAQELGVNIFPGFPATTLLTDGQRLVGVRTADRNRGADGGELPNFQPGMELRARVTILADGTRSKLAQSYFAWQGIESPNPQIYALGIKELWQVPKAPEAIVHTMGWPLDAQTFGGSFLYPVSDDTVAIGLVMGLDYEDASIDPHYQMQKAKTHPFFRKVLEGGTRLEWGAKTIPEGGYFSLPDRLSGDGAVILGDAAGFVNVPALKGIHYAMESGMLAAEAIASAFAADDFSAARLRNYDDLVQDSFITKDLHRVRHMRQVFSGGLYRGLVNAGLVYAAGGRWPWPHHTRADGKAPRVPTASSYPKPDGKLVFDKADSVGLANNVTRSDMPSHLDVPSDLPPDVARFYARMCPAHVYEIDDADQLLVNPSNCIDCMTSDILAARWFPREGGSGPRYRAL